MVRDGISPHPHLFWRSNKQDDCRPVLHRPSLLSSHLHRECLLSASRRPQRRVQFAVDQDASEESRIGRSGHGEQMTGFGSASCHPDLRHKNAQPSARRLPKCPLRGSPDQATGDRFGSIVLKKSGTEGPSAIFESEGPVQHRFIAIARAITNHTFVRSSASDFFNTIGRDRSLNRAVAPSHFVKGTPG